MSNIPKKGATALATAVILSPEMDEETIRQIPMGGVSMPIARFVTTIIPK